MFGHEITSLGETTHDNRGEIKFEFFFGIFFPFEGTLWGTFFKLLFFGTFYF
jgi:hypothetical protein